MAENEIDPLLVTYVIEESLGADGKWYSTVEAAELSAHGSVLWLIEHIDRYPAEFHPWLQSGYRKHLRRAKIKDFERLIAEEKGLVVTGPRGRLFISEIHSKSQTPKVLSRLQLSGFKPHDESPWASSFDAPVEVILNDSLGMSFGKAVVASAHAAQQLALTLMTEDPEALNTWSLADYRVNASFGIPEVSSGKHARIEDHGLTEVPAGSVTAVANFS